jgi:hypothetical protein
MRIPKQTIFLWLLAVLLLWSAQHFYGWRTFVTTSACLAMGIFGGWVNRG